MTIIAHIDMDAFFASIEQRDNPDLYQQPTVVLANQYSKIVIAASYEAKALGYKVGKKATFKDPVHIRYANLSHYQAISNSIMSCLSNITPDIEIFSIDEAFLNLDGIIHHYPSVLDLAKHIKACVLQATQLPCSIGIGPNKVIAKLASSEHKPNGLYIVTDTTSYLHHKPIQKVCGIGKKMQSFLNQHGVYTCDQMKTIPISFLSGRFGQIGRHLWYACQGLSTSTLSKPQRPKSMGHSKRLEVKPYQRPAIEKRLNQLCVKLCERLRSKDLKAQSLHISIYSPKKRYQQRFKIQPTHCPQDLKVMYLPVLKTIPWPIILTQIGIRVTDLTSFTQLDWLEDKPDINQLMDQINKRKQEIQYASLLD